ncbi:MAG: endo alpha-1,4 polygalactosaminidase [Lachnospiraceae bacterium]|nr:endo alpha-1,4 polygalactosaminidase [Lachnospiraceae bacterium]
MKFFSRIVRSALPVILLCFLAGCASKTDSGGTGTYTWVTKPAAVPYEGTPKIATATPGGPYPSATEAPVTPTPTPTMKVYGPIEKERYGIRLDLDGEDYEEAKKYSIVVIDADKFTWEQIREIKKEGVTVYSYLNIGALEEFRDFYKDYKKYALDPCGDSDDVYWMDVTQSEWKKHLLDKAWSFKRRGVDGYFVDNCDVYSKYKSDKAYNAIEDILTRLRRTGEDDVVNGGDEFVTEYIFKNSSVSYILSGVNREGVFTVLDRQKGTSDVPSEEDHKRAMLYLRLVDEFGAKVYLTEYTTDEKIIDKIKEACEPKAWCYYLIDPATTKK